MVARLRRGALVCTGCSPCSPWLQLSAAAALTVGRGTGQGSGMPWQCHGQALCLLVSNTAC